MTRHAGDSSETTLTLKTVASISGTYTVPSYQRGYRWSKPEVDALLNDIWTHGDGDYCLQPIVLKRDADGFELIDGQQRMTTLWLIFHYIKVEVMPKLSPPFELNYTTRPRSGTYLRTLGLPCEDDTDARDDEGDNIDYFHLRTAYDCICSWFEDKPMNAPTKLLDRLCEQVKVIWYEVDDDTDAYELFLRLNDGRIPLTNAELVRALFVRAADRAQARDRFEIATQWDALERELQEPGYWAFLTNVPAASYSSRLELVFDSLAGPAEDNNRFATFEFFREALTSKSIAVVWEAIVDRCALLREWYENVDLYHKVGYLVAAGVDLQTLIVGSSGTNKSAFHAWLDGQIGGTIHIDAQQLAELSYKNDAERCSRVLLLFNVETQRCRQDSWSRYPFDKHKTQSWTLEHIHAQHSEQLRTAEAWTAWLRSHASVLRDCRLKEGQEASRVELIHRIEEALPNLKRKDFERLAPEVVALLGGAADDMHQISNLALLNSASNSALSNSVFEVKRRKMIERDHAGHYIPVTTRNVFLKYYSRGDATHLHFWGQRDQDGYLAAMTAALTPYLAPAKEGDSL